MKFLTLIILYINILNLLPNDNLEYNTLEAESKPVTVESKLNHLSKLENLIKKLNDLLLSYKICVDRIKLENFEKIKNYCFGENNQRIMNDLNFEIMKITAKSSKLIKYIMINYCFSIAGPDMLYQDSCDTYQTDVLDLLWKTYDVKNIIKSNRDKYVYEHAKLPNSKFDELNIRIGKVLDNNFQLVKEILNWKVLIINSMGKFVDNLKNQPEYIDKKKYNELSSSFLKNVISSMNGKKEFNISNDDLQNLKKYSKKIQDRTGSAPINPDEIIPEIVKNEEKKIEDKNKQLEDLLKEKNKNIKLEEELKESEEKKLENNIISKKEANITASKKSLSLYKYIMPFLLILIIN